MTKNLKESEVLIFGGDLVGLGVVIGGVITVIAIGIIIEGIGGVVDGNLWTVIFGLEVNGVMVLVVVILLKVTFMYSFIGVVTELFEVLDSLIIFEEKIVLDTVAFTMLFITAAVIRFAGVGVVVVKYNLATSSNGLTIN